MKITIKYKLLLLITIDIIYSYLCYYLLRNSFLDQNIFLSIIQISFLSLPFIFLLLVKTGNIGIKKKIWFILSDFFMSTIFIFYFLITTSPFLNYFNIFFEFFSIFLASFLGGILTFYNYSCVTNYKYETKKYLLYNFLISFCLATIVFLLSYQFRGSFANLVGYWTYLSFLPEILSVIIWQLFNYYFLTSKLINENNQN